MKTEETRGTWRSRGGKTLTKNDLELLMELERNARQNFVQIAKKLRISKQLIRYRLRNLIRRKILSGFYTIINFRMLGYTAYRTMIRLSHITEQKHKDIMAYLSRHPNVQWLVECGGRWDFIANFSARNIIQYDKFLRDLKGRFPDQIQNYDVLTTVEIMDFSRDYLSAKRRDPRERAWYGDVFEVSGVDLLDMKILDLISRDARMSSIKIARRLEVSPNTVLKRIEAMKEKNLIIGFKPLVNLDNTPFAAYKALVKYQNITERAEKEIIDFLKADPHVLAIIRLIGLWDFEFEFEVDSLQMMRSITNRFRDRFKDVIKEFEILPLYHEYKYNFFPGDLLAR